MIDYFLNIHDMLLDPARFPIALLAMALTAVLGLIRAPMDGNANPFMWLAMDKTLGNIGTRLDRKERASKTLMTRGMVFTFATLFVIAFVGTTAREIVLANPFYGITEIVLLSLTLTGGTVWYALIKLYAALTQNKKDKKSSVSEGAYYIIARSSRIDLSGSDDYSITRTGMSYAARAFDKALVAPIFWYLLTGLPGVYIYAALAWLSWRFGKDGSNKGFGKVAEALENLLGFVPSLLAGLLIALGGLFTPTGGMTRALLSILPPHKHARYHEGGSPVSAMAYALDVSLGGPVTDIDGSTIKREWVGPKKATAKLEAHHLRRALYIILMAFILFIASLMSAMLFAG